MLLVGKKCKRQLTITDADGNGSIDFQEMILGLSALIRGTVEEKLSIIFKAFDKVIVSFSWNLLVKDKSGGLSREEILSMLQEGGLFKILKKKNATKIDGYVDSLFAALDTNRDGLIQPEEFLQVLRLEPNLVSVFFDSTGAPYHKHGNCASQ